MEEGALVGAGGQGEGTKGPAPLHSGGWRRQESSRWGLKEPPLAQSPQHGRCISSFLSSYLPAPYTASLNKFAYFYAMSSRHQKEQAAPSPSSLPLPPSSMQAHLHPAGFQIPPLLKSQGPGTSERAQYTHGHIPYPPCAGQDK